MYRCEPPTFIPVVPVNKNLNVNVVSNEIIGNYFSRNNQLLWVDFNIVGDVLGEDHLSYFQSEPRACREELF